jgi:hypothetical protein
MPGDTEDRISGFAELVASVVVAGYREEQKRQLLVEESQRPLLMDSLLEGRVIDRWSLWEAARFLRLPANGPFVVMAAEVGAVGKEALPEIESKLRSRDVYSAWRLQPDLQVGIVHVKSDRHLEGTVALVSRSATNRVGVSARFEDLREAPQAFHFARVMLRDQPDRASPVAVFDGSILATAAVSAPDVMMKLVGNALGGFDGPPTSNATCCSRRFGYGRTTMRHCVAPPRRLSAIPTPSAIDCVGSSSAPAEPFRAQGMSPNCVWPSKCNAG